HGPHGAALKRPRRPADDERMFQLEPALKLLVAMGGSDLHLAAGCPPTVRVRGELEPVPGAADLTARETESVLAAMVDDAVKLAAMVDHINRTKARHVVTIEDPIEFVHRNRRSIVNQREVGADTASFRRALRRVLRQDPDVILIGEMRDEETVGAALSAAATGHLVLSTIHTVDASESINRMLDFFPPHQHGQARSMIAGTIKGVISQRLVP